MTSATRLHDVPAFRQRYGPWAVVTGASSGIGRGLATQLAAVGLGVVLVARRDGLLEDLAAGLQTSYGSPVRVLPADLSTQQGVRLVAEHTGDLDVGLIVAAAGFGTSGPFLAADRHVEQEQLALNCAAVLGLCLSFAPRLASRGRGGIVLMGSLVGRQGTPGASSYAASKAYVQTLAEGLYAELRPHGVDVLVSAPGPVHSGFADRAGMRMTRAMPASGVALPTLNALGRRSTVVPGALSKALTWSLAPLPRRARVQAMGAVMTSMTAHRQRAAHPA